jgi:hypothetical protein
MDVLGDEFFIIHDVEVMSSFTFWKSYHWGYKFIKRK